MNQIVLNGVRLYSVSDIHIILVLEQATVGIEVKPWVVSTLYKSNSMWIISSGSRLVASTVVHLGKIVIFL